MSFTKAFRPRKPSDETVVRSAEYIVNRMASEGTPKQREDLLCGIEDLKHLFPEVANDYNDSSQHKHDLIYKAIVDILKRDDEHSLAKSNIDDIFAQITQELQCKDKEISQITLRVNPNKNVVTEEGITRDMLRAQRGDQGR